MKERLKKIAPWVGYPVFYVFAFAVFSLITFPYDKLKERIVTSFNAKERETNGHDELQIGEISGYWLTGLRMKDVRLLTQPADPTQPPTEMKIDEARVRLSVLPLIIGNQNLSFKLTAFGGQIDGSYAMSGKDKEFDVTLSGVDIGQVEPVTSLIGLPASGKLSGTIKLTLPEGKATAASGAVALEATELAVGDGKAKLKGALPLPRLLAGTLSLAAEAKAGVLKITKFTAGGKDKDLELAGDGRVQMYDATSDSVCDINLRFKINDVYRSKNDITKSLFGAPGSTMPPLFEMDKDVKASKRPDGFYGWSMRGTLGKPVFVPNATGPAVSPAGAGTATVGAAPLPR